MIDNFEERLNIASFHISIQVILSIGLRSAYLLMHSTFSLCKYRNGSRSLSTLPASSRVLLPLDPRRIAL